MNNRLRLIALWIVLSAFFVGTIGLPMPRHMERYITFGIKHQFVAISGEWQRRKVVRNVNVLDGVERRPDGSYNVKLDFAGVPSGIAALGYAVPQSVRHVA